MYTSITMRGKVNDAYRVSPTRSTEKKTVDASCKHLSFIVKSREEKLKLLSARSADLQEKTMEKKRN